MFCQQPNLPRYGKTYTGSQLGTPVISAVMAAKNAEKTIGLAIKSLLLALSAQDEVLVMLDGCEDRTEWVVNKIRDPRLRIFSNTVSAGRSAARNSLIARARGEYVAILDADDICLPWRFYLARRLLKRNDAVFGTAIVFGRQLGPLCLIPQVPRRINASEMPLECLARNPLVHSSAIFRVGLVGDRNFYLNSEAEDYELWLRLINAGVRMVRSAIPVVMYRLHPNQVTRTSAYIHGSSECQSLVTQQRVLADKLGYASEELDQVREQVLMTLKRRGPLSYLEVMGLSGLKKKYMD